MSRHVRRSEDVRNLKAARERAREDGTRGSGRLRRLVARLREDR